MIRGTDFSSIATDADGRPEPSMLSSRSTAIVHGGGWNIPPTKEEVQIKALACGFLSIGTVAAGIHFEPDYGPWVLVPSVVLFFTTLLLFHLERPTTVRWASRSGGNDPRKLYAARRGIGKGA